MHSKLFLALFLANTISAHPLIDEAMRQEAVFRLATQTQIAEELNAIKTWPTTLSLAEINERVLAQLQHDLEVAKDLQTVLNSAGYSSHTSWSARTNKLALVLPAAIDFFTRHGDELMHGQLPNDMRRRWDSPRKNDASNLRELALKASLFVLLDVLGINPIGDQWLDDSPTIHTTQLPSNLPPGLTNWTFFFNGTLSPVEGEIVFTHGGYALGGQRVDSRYRRFGTFGKPLGPQDCSSWISKLIGAPVAFTTADFMAQTDKFLKTRLQRLDIANISQVQPGMIYVTRNTRNQTGHIVLVMGVVPATATMQVMEYGRDLPHHEGFGLRRIDFGTAAHIQSAYFNVK